MKYFGKHKLCSTSVYEYQGSGTDWTNHLAKYGDDCLTYVLGIWDESDPRLEAIALSFSVAHNIVESDKWANMKLENGLDGGWDHINNQLGGNPFWSIDHMTMMSKKGKENCQLRLKNLRKYDSAWVKWDSNQRSIGQLKSYKDGRVSGMKGKKGQVWITKDSKNMKIWREKEDFWVMKGWKRGRHFKKVKCEYCGVEMATNNIKQHQKLCISD